MQIVTSAAQMQEISQELRRKGLTIGCVPTMGYFHEGHLSLIRSAGEENDRVVVSLFINPKQFGENEDFSLYPRDWERDRRLAEEQGVDVIFVPTMNEMYSEDFSTHVEVSGLTEVMCGASRPGHFKGVTTVVAKLFNIMLPHRVYFGQKDTQQALVIKKMVRDLNFPLEVRVMPIVREEDGLAMSSRNVYLSKEERQAALVLPRGLEAARKALENGERSARELESIIHEVISSSPLPRIDYVTIREINTLEEVDVISGPVLVAAAVWIGRTRLIDNFFWEEE